MIRHCDGTDVNVTREVYYNEVGERLVTPWRTRDPATVNIACDCGATFDDVERMVIYPHHAV